MKLIFSDRGWSDYQHWLANDPDTLTRLNELIRECMRHPFRGMGKPEPLRNELQGWWSRRVTLNDRLLYRVSGKGEAQQLEIIACRFHYD